VKSPGAFGSFSFRAFAAVGVLSAVAVSSAQDTRLVDAAMGGDRMAVRALLKSAADVNTPQGDGMTALHWAASNDDVEMARLLVAAGANVRAATRVSAMTPLLLAAQSGSAPVIDLLLGAGADPDTASSLGVTPLMFASAAGSADAIKTLVARGANVNAQETTYGQTPLMFAAAGNHVRAIQTLVELGGKIDVATRIRSQGGRGGGGRGGAPGGGDAGRGGGRGAGAAADQEAAAGRGAGRGGAAGGRGGGRGGRGGGGADQAAGGGRGAQPAAQGQTSAQPAPAAAPGAATPATANPAAGSAPAAPAERSIDDDPDGAAEARGGQEPMGGLAPLHYAARQGHLEATRALLDSGAGIDQLTGDRTTPLMIAIINGRFDLAMYLLERGADPKLATMAGGTPLYRVVDLQWAPKSFYPQPDIRQQRISYLDLMKALIDRGANPNARLSRQLWYTTYGFDLDALDPSGATPFWRAAQAGDLDAMKLLAAHGANPSLGTNDNVTPLLALAGDGFHGNDAIVVPAGRMPAMRYLVEELKADVNALDERGGAATSILHQNTRAYSAIHAAAARGDNEMILYLVSKGARVDFVGKNGLTAADMANGPRERIQPFPETIQLLIKLGSKFSNRCISC
jgi:ankyrin repeat protein